jgi:steroid delta-isomerase
MSDIIAAQLKSLQFEYEHIQMDRINHLIAHYAVDATFKDPFQEVNGHEAITHIFEKMFTQLDSPSFKVLSVMHEGLEASLLWEFKFAFKRWNQSPQSLKGVSWLTFNEAGLITSHIDYWDPAEGIYEKLPLIGSLIRFLKKQA